jgi:D-glycero-alpha-D-manno-heptose 1-phosphate guanylyltransferase
MEAIILAGGFGTRLQDVIKNIPKPMAPVGNKPFLEYILDSFHNAGIKRVVFSTGYKSETIINYFGSNYKDIALCYVTEKFPLGTGGGIKLALEKCKSNHALIVNGDTFLDCNINDVFSLWHKNQNPIIVATRVDDLSRYGELLVDSNNHVIGFKEKNLSAKGDSGLINAGFYLFDKSELDHFDINKPFSLEQDYLEQSVTQKIFDVYICNGQFIDIGIPSDYHRALDFFDKLGL